MKSKTKSIGSFEAKTHLSSLIDDVQKGGEYIITKRGKPVAKLVPFRDQDGTIKIEDIVSRFDSIRNNVRGRVNIGEYIREGRKY